MSQRPDSAELQDLTARKVGRPRRFDPATEIEMISDAALAVMQRHHDRDLTVSEILSEAGMSTRSFYRHFASKDELLCALYRRDAERAQSRLEAKVADAAGPEAALEAWIDEVLSYGHNQAKAKRVAVLGSNLVTKADGVQAEARRAADRIVAPLIDVLERGKAAGVFPLADPVSDAESIRAVVWAAAGLTSTRAGLRNRVDARNAVLSFTRRALGARD